MLKKYLIKILTFLTFFSLTYQAQAESFKIGLSNGWVGSEWRTQMIDEAKEAAAAWTGEGVEIEVLVQSANVDVPGQIAHVKNFISQGVDAIIINPNSPTAFDPVFKQAKAKGVLVISTDAEVSKAGRGAIPLIPCTAESSTKFAIPLINGQVKKKPLLPAK